MTFIIKCGKQCRTETFSINDFTVGVNFIFVGVVCKLRRIYLKLSKAQNIDNPKFVIKILLSTLLHIRSQRKENSPGIPAHGNYGNVKLELLRKY